MISYCVSDVFTRRIPITTIIIGGLVVPEAVVFNWAWALSYGFLSATEITCLLLLAWNY